LFDLISKKVGNKIDGHLDDMLLYNDMYIEQEQSKIIGVLAATTQPISLSSLISLHKFNPKIFHECFEKLISQGLLNGSVEGKKDTSVYTPKIFTSSRDAYIKSFYEQNNYVEFQAINKMQVPNAKNYLTTKFKNGISLTSCFVNKNIVDQLETLISETIENNGWEDLTEHLPSFLTSQDIDQMLSKSAVLKKSQNQISKMCESYLVSKGFLDRFVKIYEADLQSKLEKGLLKQSGEIEESPKNFSFKESRRNQKTCKIYSICKIGTITNTRFKKRTKKSTKKKMKIES